MATIPSTLDTGLSIWNGTDKKAIEEMARRSRDNMLFRNDNRFTKEPMDDMRGKILSLDAQNKNASNLDPAGAERGERRW